MYEIFRSRVDFIVTIEMEGRWRNIENCCPLTLTRDVTTGLSKRPLRNNRSVSSATLPSSSRLSRTCMKAAGTVTRHFSITPCYLVVREGQRHCRHERRREGVKERREGVPGVAIRRINIGIQPQVAGARDISLGGMDFWILILRKFIGR